MKLRTRMWMILGVTLVVILGVDLAVAWHRIQADQRTELEIDVHTIRGILMATRRVYHQQFIQSGLPVTEATVGFLNTMAKVPRVHKRKLPVGLVVNRSKPWTNTSQQAVEMLKTWPYPVVAQLRDTQAYVVMAGLGRSLFDYKSAQVRDHQADWDPLLKWVKKA